MLRGLGYLGSGVQSLNTPGEVKEGWYPDRVHSGMWPGQSPPRGLVTWFTSFPYEEGGPAAH